MGTIGIIVTIVGLNCVNYSSHTTTIHYSAWRAVGFPAGARKFSVFLNIQTNAGKHEVSGRRVEGFLGRRAAGP
jgi:hypothetical protein